MIIGLLSIISSTLLMTLSLRLLSNRKVTQYDIVFTISVIGLLTGCILILLPIS
jgi:Co/Zn/Cd efflux system component